MCCGGLGHFAGWSASTSEALGFPIATWAFQRCRSGRTICGRYSMQSDRDGQSYSAVPKGASYACSLRRPIPNEPRHSFFTVLMLKDFGHRTILGQRLERTWKKNWPKSNASGESLGIWEEGR